jgi:hypothetical protein
VGSENGKFGGGKLTAQAIGFVCAVDFRGLCSNAVVLTRTVQLHGGGP